MSCHIFNPVGVICSYNCCSSFEIQCGQTARKSRAEKEQSKISHRTELRLCHCLFVCLLVSKIETFFLFQDNQATMCRKNGWFGCEIRTREKWEFRHLKLMAIIWVESELLYSVHPDKALIVLCKGHFCHDLFWQSLMTSLHAIVWFGIVSGHVLRDVGKCLEAENLFGEQRELLFSGWTLIVCMWYYLNRASDNLVSRWLCLAFLIW